MQLSTGEEFPPSEPPTKPRVPHPTPQPFRSPYKKRPVPAPETPSPAPAPRPPAIDTPLPSTPADRSRAPRPPAVDEPTLKTAWDSAARLLAGRGVDIDEVVGRAADAISKFEQRARAAWDDDSIELSDEDERHIEVARERVLSFVKDQALLDWLDEEDSGGSAAKQTEHRKDNSDPRPDLAEAGKVDVAESGAPAELARFEGGDADVAAGSTTSGLVQEPAPLVRVTGGALDADAPKPNWVDQPQWFVDSGGGNDTTSSQLTVDAPKQGYGPDEVFKRFLMNRSDDTLKAYRSDIELFAQWLGASPEVAISRLLGNGFGQANALAMEWLDSMRGLAASTRKRRLSALRSVVRMARRLGAVEWTLDVDSPKAEAYRDTAGPTGEQLQKLFQACGEGLEGLRNRAIVALAVFMAFRRREIAAFRQQDYDRVRRRIFVRGKGNKNKWIGAPDQVVDALEEWLAAPKTIIDKEKIFLSLSPSTRGKALSRKGVYHTVTKIGERAGVKIWPHALRHAGITTLLDENNGDVRMAQEFGRHADPKTTMMYDDNRADMAGKAAKLVADKLMPKK